MFVFILLLRLQNWISPYKSVNMLKANKRDKKARSLDEYTERILFTQFIFIEIYELLFSMLLRVDSNPIHLSRKILIWHLFFLNDAMVNGKKVPSYIQLKWLFKTFHWILFNPVENSLTLFSWKEKDVQRKIVIDASHFVRNGILLI